MVGSPRRGMGTNIFLMLAAVAYVMDHMSVAEAGGGTRGLPVPVRALRGGGGGSSLTHPRATPRSTTTSNSFSLALAPPPPPQPPPPQPPALKVTVLTSCGSPHLDLKVGPVCFATRRRACPLRAQFKKWRSLEARAPCMQRQPQGTGRGPA
jgi:hypothetical protein